MLLSLTLALCLLMWLICFIGTGTERKNLKNIKSYPKEIKNQVFKIKEYKEIIKKDKIEKEPNLIKVFIINTITFSIILFIFGIFIRTNNYLNNFINILIMGEFLNSFDLLIIDILWWRNSPRIRFNKIPDKVYYKDIKPHINSFLRGIPMFLVVALIDGFILTLF